MADPILDISTAPRKEAPAVRIDGMDYQMAGAEHIQLRQQLELVHLSARIQSLDPKTLDEKELTNFEQTVKNACRSVLPGIPDSTLDKLGILQMMKIIGAYSKELLHDPLLQEGLRPSSKGSSVEGQPNG